MAKKRILYPAIFYLGIAVVFLPGCVYLTHFKEVMFVKSLEANQKEMQAELDKEDKLYVKLRADIDNLRLDRLAQKHGIFHRYGEPVLCRPAELPGGMNETCIYRKPAGGLLTEIILLNFDIQGRLLSWQIQGPGK